MKTIKLLVLFFIIVGGIFIAMNWDSIFEFDNYGDNFASENLIDISEKCDEIRSAWSSRNAWDEQLYKTQREDVDQSKSMGMFSKEGFNTVNNCLRESATNKACNSYSTELHASPFSDVNLQNAYKGVMAIKAFEKLEEESRILKIEGIHNLYSNISRFVKSGHKITPSFDAETGNWVSFIDYQNRILTQARSYRGNSLYKEMSHIPGFNSGLDEESLKKLTNGQRQGFYQQLSNQIIAFFKSEDPTDDRKKMLNNVYTKFVTEEKEYGVEELASFVVNYKE